MTLVQELPQGPLDIVGDIHGETDALRRLLRHLGYDHDGNHPQGRKLVFVGDFCDRGPDSPGAIALVRHLLQRNNAFAILGNHEINLLANDIKDGSGWFFDERLENDLRYYAPFERARIEERDDIRHFLASLPVALVREDIRVVHAAWTAPAIEAVQHTAAGDVVAAYQEWDGMAQQRAQESGLYQRYLEEKSRWAYELESEEHPPPFLYALAEYEAMQQMINPLKILTSGVEEETPVPFFAGNRWRYSDRTPWWNAYEDHIPVVVGHYWRMYRPPAPSQTSRYSMLFEDVPGNAWLGRNGKVFCVDYSVGARWRDRKAGRPLEQSSFRLAALQWPERQLVFENGEIVATQ